MTSTNKDIPDKQEAVSSEAPENSSTAQTEITPPHSATTGDIPEFGWSAYAERVNGRFAMIGFAAVLAIEALSGNAFLHWAGFLQ